MQKVSIFKKLASIVTAVALCFINASLLCVCLGSIKPKANLNAANQTETADDFTNGSFSNVGSGSSYPKSPNEWTAGSTSADIVKGVISTTTTDWAKYYSTSYKLSTTSSVGSKDGDNMVLMINNTHETSALSFNYKSNSFTLDAGEYYIIEGYAKTLSGGVMSIYLTDDLNTHKIDSSFSLNTDGNWTRFVYYVETDDTLSSTVNLNLHLGTRSQGSEGSVFFDAFKVNKVTPKDYNLLYSQEIKNETTGEVDPLYAKKINLNEAKYTNIVTNADFENGTAKEDNLNFEGWTRVDTNPATTAEAYISGTTESGTYNALSTNQKALYINNIKEAYTGFTSDEFIIPQNALVKISFWAKASADDKAYATLTAKSYSKNGEEVSATPSASQSVSITKGELNSVHYGWKEFSFYVTGHPNFDTSVSLELAVGKTDGSVAGYCYFDDVTTQVIDSASFEAGVKDGTEVTLHKFEGASVENGYFNFASDVSYNKTTDGEKDVYNVKYPLAPASWKQTSLDKTFDASIMANSGIIDSNETVFASTVSGVANPGETPIQANAHLQNKKIATNNLLMIGNKLSTSQGYKFTADALTMNASSYYKISFVAKTTNLSTNGSASFIVKNGETIISSTTITSEAWNTYEIFVKTSLYSASITPELWLGYNAPTSGYVFFDDIKFTSIEETAFSEAVSANASFTSIIDLNEEQFDNGALKEGYSAFYAPNAYTGKLVENASQLTDEKHIVDAGIVDLSNTDGLNNDFPTLSSFNIGSETSSNILMIHGIDEVNYEFTSNSSFTAVSGSYYKVKVLAKVLNIAGAENANADYVGASIKLSGFNNYFYGIDSTNGLWQEFSFFINPSSETNFNIVLALGNADALTRGYLFVDSVEITTFASADDYNAEYSSLTTGNTNAKAIKIETPASTTNEEEPEETPVKTSFNWLWIPSIVLGISLIIAIIGTAIKGIKPKKRIKAKKGSAEYDKEAIKAKQQKAENKKAFKEKLIGLITINDEDEEK